MQITWKIESLDRKVNDGYVTTAHWRCIGNDGSNDTSVYGSCEFKGPLTTPYERLTQQQVLQWCWESGINKALVEQDIVNQMRAITKPVSKPGLPW